MRLIVARCEVRYTGRLDALLPEALRLIMIKSDGSVLVHADHGSYKPSNWMTPPTTIEESPEHIVVRKFAGKDEDRLDIRVVEVLSDVTHDMGEAAALEKDGVEAHLQELLAEQPHWCGEGFRLVRREWPTDIGPVDLMCRDEADDWIAVEIKRVGNDRRRRAADPLPRADQARSGEGRRAAACSRRRRSSRRRECSPRRAGSPASRSTSACCAASASPT